MQLRSYQFKDFSWVDVSETTPEDLLTLSEKYSLDGSVLSSTLTHRHLPKFEELADALLLVLRTPDDAVKESESIYESTQKLVIFVRKDLIFTLHRSSLDVVDKVWKKFSVEMSTSSLSPKLIFSELAKHAILSFENVLSDIEKELEGLESIIFSDEFSIELHHLRGQLTSIKRLLWHTKAVIQRVAPTGKIETALAQWLGDHTNHLIYFSDELYEDATSLLNLQISLSSQRTNEVIRVLTIFSVFFMPLTFIVGIYGMNFDHMPELSWTYGYPAVGVLMLVIVCLIGWWFQKRGWLKF